jgi:signal transduction histidine kinase
VNQAATNEPVPARKEPGGLLPHHEAYVQLAYEAANLGIWQHDLRSGEVAFDPRAQEHYGFSAGPVPFTDVLARIHRDDVARLQQEIAAATDAAGTGKFATEYRVCHPDGTLHWLLVHVRVTFTGDGSDRQAILGFGTSQDITATKVVEERLRGRTEELERIFDLLPAAIWIADDPQCMEVRGNAYANALLEVDPDTNVSQSADSGSPVRLRQFSAGRELSADELPMQKAAATGVPQLDIDLRIDQPNGRTVSLIGGAVPLFDGQGRPRGAIAAFHDVTARRQAERNLHRTLEELQRSNADLEQFAYVASHDLQEPLRAMSGMVQLLRQRYRSQLDARGLEYIDLAVESAARMQALIGALLSFSRLDRAVGPRAAVDMNDVLAHALANLSVALREAQAEVLAEPLPMVVADAAQLTQVLQNLIGNAVKFRGDQPPQIRIGVTPVAQTWQFHVRDNGIGIDPEYFDRIFVIFQRLHGRRDYGGMGIGLALCKKIVERHGGRIWVESAPGAGATFFFTLPRDHEESG